MLILLILNLLCPKCFQLYYIIKCKTVLVLIPQKWLPGCTEDGDDVFPAGTVYILQRKEVGQ